MVSFPTIDAESQAAVGVLPGAPEVPGVKDEIVRDAEGCAEVTIG